MFAPAAMQIYSAEDALKDKTLNKPNFILSELKELRSSNAETRQHGPNAFENGYLLGLEVARNILGMEPKIIQAGLSPKDLL